MPPQWPWVHIHGRRGLTPTVVLYHPYGVRMVGDTVSVGYHPRLCYITATRFCVLPPPTGFMMRSRSLLSIQKSNSEQYTKHHKHNQQKPHENAAAFAYLFDRRWNVARLLIHDLHRYLIMNDFRPRTFTCRFPKT